jgi:hypothetical protein
MFTQKTLLAWFGSVAVLCSAVLTSEAQIPNKGTGNGTGTPKTGTGQPKTGPGNHNPGTVNPRPGTGTPLPVNPVPQFPTFRTNPATGAKNNVNAGGHNYAAQMLRNTENALISKSLMDSTAASAIRPNPFVSPVDSNPFANPFNNPFANSFNNPFNNTFNNPFANPFANQFNNPFSNSFNSPFNNPFANPFASQFNNPFANPFANQFNNPYAFNNGFNNPFNNPFGMNTMPGTFPTNFNYGQTFTAPGVFGPNNFNPAFRPGLFGGPGFFGIGF